jgi:hypothetical protein
MVILAGPLGGRGCNATCFSAVTSLVTTTSCGTWTSFVQKLPLSLAGRR